MQKRKGSRLGLALTLALAVLAMMVGTVAADLIFVDPPNAWDVTSSRFENGNVTVAADGSWVSFLHEIDFDDDVFSSSACGDTAWAGVGEYGLYHVDNIPAGGNGWQATRNFQLVSCDRDGDGDNDNDDLSFAPPTAVTPYGVAGNLTLLFQDMVDTTPCIGNCESEIVTNIEYNLDLNCDGTVDTPVPAGGICVYYEAQMPDSSAPGYIEWQGPFQARINEGSGDKTLNFSISDPSAVGMSGQQATGTAMWMPLLIVTVTAGLAVLSLRLRRN